MILSRLVLFIFISAGICSLAIGQNEEVADVVKKFGSHSLTNLHEKVYVHTDKDVYLSNEIVWLKIYSVSEMLHKPLALSKVVYVEILDAGDTAVVQSKISMASGKGNGSLDISTLSSGNYRLRAYTRWMMNYDADYFFEKEITVFNTQSIPISRSNTTTQEVRVEFFPEGGNLVDALTSNVAFKIVDRHGNGMDAVGVVVNQKGDTVVTFQPLKFGMGRFSFTPQKGEQYTAVVQRVGQRTSSNHKLPDVHDYGYVMQAVSKVADKLTITIWRNKPTTESEYVFLFAHTRQQAKAVTVGYFKDNKTTFTLDINKLGDGISHLTIFSSDKKPICERLFFKRPQNQLTIQAKAQMYLFSTRDEINVTINTLSSNSLPVPANMSFSVYAIDSVQQVLNQAGILSYFSLTSDLKGYIQNPDYYLTETDSTSLKACDNLMLTHGWRKFNWEAILNSEAATLKYVPEYEGLSLSGNAKNDSTGMFADTVQVYLSVPGKNPLFQVVKTDRKGNFNFYINKLEGTNSIVLQAGNNSFFQYDVSLGDTFSSSRNHTWSIPDFSFNKAVEQTLRANMIHTQVERTFKEPIRFTNSIPDSSEFYGLPEVTYLLDDYVRFPTLEDVFREYIPEVIVRRQDKKAQVYILNSATQIFFTQEPLILLDGIPALNTNVLLRSNAEAVKKINLINRKYFFGSVSYPGIIDISTYKGNLAGFELNPGAVVIDYEALQRERIFDLPNYTLKEIKESRLPDFRNVLLWQPDLDTDKSGLQNVKFFTSDKKGTFIAVIHGITPDGLMGSKSFTFTVK